MFLIDIFKKHFTKHGINQGDYVMVKDTEEKGFVLTTSFINGVYKLRIQFKTSSEWYTENQLIKSDFLQDILDQDQN